MVSAPPGSTPIVAEKQIYASHYFEAFFGLTAVFDGPYGGEAPGTYVIMVRPYRFDNLPSGLYNIRGRVRDQLLNALRADLERERADPRWQIRQAGGTC